MNEATIWKFFRGKGLNSYGVAGLMGNLYAESALNPQNLQQTYERKLGFTDASYTAAVDSGSYTNFVRDSAGYGLAQWTYWSRKEALLNFVKARGTSIGDLNAQLDFLWKELGQYGLVDSLKHAQSVLEASNLILLNFEKPASMNEPSTQRKRAEYGQRYYDEFAANEAATTAGQEGVSSMKYTEKNKPLVCMMTNSTCYKGTRKMEVKGVLWHSTGANNPNLKRYVQPSSDDPNYAKLMEMLGKNTGGNDWNHVSVQAGLNCWIGKLADGTVTTIQTMPWDYRPWGCGSGPNGSCNTGWIQFEICEDNLTDPDYFNKAYREACEITAYLCKMYNIDPHGTVKVGSLNVPTILCHADSHSLGLGSNHGDVNHWFPKFGKSMATVRDDVAALLGGSAPAAAPETPTTNVSYQGRVTANSGLNCRTAPVNGAVVMTYPKDAVISITKEQGGWGYTGAGWVSLNYVEKISTTTTTETEDDDMDVNRFTELWNEMRKGLQDNDASAYSAEARAWATGNGLIKGNGTTINGEPNCMWGDVLTREQFVTVLYRWTQMIGKA